MIVNEPLNHPRSLNIKMEHVLSTTNTEETKWPHYDQYQVTISNRLSHNVTHATISMQTTRDFDISSCTVEVYDTPAPPSPEFPGLSEALGWLMLLAAI